MAECGTVAKYHAHYREAKESGGKVECGPCLSALADSKKRERHRKRQQEAENMSEAIGMEPDVEPGLDELADCRENLKLVRALMNIATSPRDMAGLSKQRADLVERIVRLEAERDDSKKKVSPLDEIAKRRAQRLNEATG